jgi:hypothetical protein
VAVGETNLMWGDIAPHSPHETTNGPQGSSHINTSKCRNPDYSPTRGIGSQPVNQEKTGKMPILLFPFVNNPG